MRKGYTELRRDMLWWYVLSCTGKIRGPARVLDAAFGVIGQATAALCTYKCTSWTR